MIIINKEKELIKKQKDELSPSYINLKNPRYMEIDGKYCSSLLVVDYSREQRDLIFKPLIDTNININMSIFYEEQDPYKVVKDLTYNIGNTAVDLEAGKNKQDIDIVEYTHDDAKYIRKQLQVNDEAFYYLYVYITIYNEDLKDLKINIGCVYPKIQDVEMDIRGRDLSTGLPKTITVYSSEMLEALIEPAMMIVDAVHSVLERTPPELAADISDRGIYMTGGGCLVDGLDKLLQEKTGINVMIAEDAISCVALGTGKALDNLDALDGKTRK